MMRQRNRHISLLITALLLASAVSNAQIIKEATNARPGPGGLDVQNSHCEMRLNPFGIDVEKPRFSWQLISTKKSVLQAGYQIFVATSMEKLMKNDYDMWNSGKISSDQSIHVEYKGKPLTSKSFYYWQVKVWSNKGDTGWGVPSQWSMGLLKPADWKAKWIGLDKAMPWDSVTQWSRLSARYYRKSFTAPAEIKRATVFVSGLGLYEMYINGRKIGEQVLAPGATDYNKSVLYNTYDVTERVQKGANVVAAVVGNGRYFTMRQNYKPQKIKTFGYPKLLMQLEIEYKDGKKSTVVTDATWKMNADGPIRTNNEYDGEEYDATKELTGWNNTGYIDTKWQAPELVSAPTGVLTAQMNEPMEVMKKIRPNSVKELKPGVWIIDMGQNMVGWLRMGVKGEKGKQIKLRYAESLQPNGELYTANLRDAKVTDLYTLRGSGESENWNPLFVYHGFRYVEVTGWPGYKANFFDFEGQVVYDAITSTGEFSSNNEILDQLVKNAWWGVSGNYKGMPLDCPQRNERMPWLGDRTVGALGESFLFNNENLYAKWLRDIEESQTAEGSIPDVAPSYWNYYSDNMTWPGAFVTVADMLYNQYGDKRPIEKHYPAMKKWLDYMRTKYMTDYIVTKDKYGDWCVPPESPELIHSKDTTRITDGKLIATAYYYRLLQLMQRFADIINKPEDKKAFSDLAANIRTAFNEKFYNKQKKCYGNNTVTSNMLPLYFGMVPDTLDDAVFNHIKERIWRQDHGHISTGLIGVQYLMRGLTRNELPDLAFTLASDTSYPSYGYMVKNGATTIWELWNGNTANPSMNSQNHVMLLGDLLTWIYEDLAGIKSDSISTGFKKIVMRPNPLDALNRVNATYKSPYGEIKSTWINRVGEFIWDFTIPANCTAILYVPATSKEDVTIDGGNMEDARFIRMEGKRAVFEIGSGKHYLVSKRPFKAGIVKDEFIFNLTSFPESHAATIVETPKGLVAAWFGGTKEGFNDVGIWMSRLVNDKWTKPVEVINGVINDTLRYACYNPVLYQVPNGELLLFYKVGPRVAGWKGWMMRSSDNGLTWGKPEALPEGFLGPVKNKPILLENGNLLCGSSTEGNGWKIHFEVTPDLGKTWKKIGPIKGGDINAIQPSILRYKDGRMQVIGRTRNRALYESWSTDQGKTWSPLALTNMPNNNSGTDAVTLQDGRQLLVYNHVLPPGKEAKGPRTPLNVAISEDGKNWSAVLVLEDSPVSQYSYPSVIQSSDGMVHIVYTWRRERVKYVKVDPSKLKPVKIENGNWP